MLQLSISTVMPTGVRRRASTGLFVKALLGSVRLGLYCYSFGNEITLFITPFQVPVPVIGRGFTETI